MIAHPQTAQSSSHRLAVITLLLFAFAIRIWHLDAQALSGDEAFSVMQWGRVSLDYLLNTIALTDPQPPAALLSFYSWIHLIGDSEFAARMLSALASTLTTAAAYGITHHFLPSRGALLACLLTAANPYQIWYAQDLRSYSLWMALSAIALFCLLNVLKRPGHPLRWMAYILSAAASIYTFYLELFLLVGHNLLVLSHSRRNRKFLLRWAISQIIIALLLAPWFLRPELRRSGYQPTAGQPDLPGALSTLLFGRTFPPDPYILSISAPVALVLILIAISLLFVLRSHPRLAVFLTVPAFLPLILLSALSLITQRGYFNPRYTSASSLPLILLIAAGLSPAPAKRSGRRTAAKQRRGESWRMRIISLASGAILAFLYARSLSHYYFDPAYAKSPPWHEVMAVLHTQPGPHDLIIRNFPDPAFDYYYQGSTPTTTLPAAENPPVSQTQHTLESLSQQYDYLWFLPIESAAFDRERSVAAWLDANMQLVSDEWIGPTRILQYASWDRLPATYNHLPPSSFGDTVQILGYRVTPPISEWTPGTTLYLELFWQPQQASDPPLTVFVHLLGPAHPDGSPLWAQDDHPPQHGRISAQTWDTSTPFRDVYRLVLPDNAPPGDYTLTTGWYDPSGARLTVDQAASQAEVSAITVLTFTLP